MSTYLIVNLLSLAGPFALSFDRKVAFWRQWKPLFPAMLLTGAFFIGWDGLFTHWGVWGFAPNHVMGKYLAGMPVEEWMFFFSIPYACVFVYECLNIYIRKDILAPVSQPIGWGLFFVSLLIGLIFYDHAYTALAFLLNAALLLWNLLRKTPYLGRFLLSYMVCLLPFGIVNGVLTALPVVWYNDAENLGIRLGTIPADDLAYNMLLLLMTINLFETFRVKPIKPIP